MSITIYLEKPRVFEWEGMQVGMRLPKVDEMKEITRARDAFFNSITETTPQGDQTLMVDYQFLVGSTLACDPTNAANSWFAKNAAEQKQLADNQVHKQLAEEMPSPFFVAATAFFNREVTKSEQTDDQREKSVVPENPPTETTEETNGTPTIPTVQNSVVSSSESQNISPLIPQPSDSGDGTIS